jgi:hypothetical protein
MLLLFLGTPQRRMEISLPRNLREPNKTRFHFGINYGKRRQLVLLQ